jgi:hypothetical protein
MGGPRTSRLARQRHWQMRRRVLPGALRRRRSVSSFCGAQVGRPAASGTTLRGGLLLRMPGSIRLSGARNEPRAYGSFCAPGKVRTRGHPAVPNRQSEPTRQ